MSLNSYPLNTVALNSRRILATGSGTIVEIEQTLHGATGSGTIVSIEQEVLLYYVGSGNIVEIEQKIMGYS